MAVEVPGRVEHKVGQVGMADGRVEGRVHLMLQKVVEDLRPETQLSPEQLWPHETEPLTTNMQRRMLGSQQIKSWPQRMDRSSLGPTAAKHSK